MKTRMIAGCMAVGLAALPQHLAAQSNRARDNAERIGEIIGAIIKPKTAPAPAPKKDHDQDHDHDRGEPSWSRAQVERMSGEIETLNDSYDRAGEMRRRYGSTDRIDSTLAQIERRIQRVRGGFRARESYEQLHDWCHDIQEDLDSIQSSLRRLKDSGRPRRPRDY